MSIFAGKTLMITGGTGSFGNAVLNRFLRTDIGEIRIFSRDEKKQDDMRQSAGGYFLKFLLEEIPEKKKAAIGVRGIRLGEDDQVEAAYLLASRIDFTIHYKDRELVLNKLKLGKRDGKGTRVRV